MTVAFQLDLGTLSRPIPDSVFFNVLAATKY